MSTDNKQGVNQDVRQGPFKFTPIELPKDKSNQLVPKSNAIAKNKSDLGVKCRFQLTTDNYNKLKTNLQNKVIEIEGKQKEEIEKSQKTAKERIDTLAGTLKNNYELNTNEMKKIVDFVQDISSGIDFNKIGSTTDKLKVETELEHYIKEYSNLSSRLSKIGTQLKAINDAIKEHRSSRVKKRDFYKEINITDITGTLVKVSGVVGFRKSDVLSESAKLIKIDLINKKYIVENGGIQYTVENGNVCIVDK